LGAINAVTKEVFTVTNQIYINSERDKGFRSNGPCSSESCPPPHYYSNPV